MSSYKKSVCVFGASSNEIDEAYFLAAEEFGGYVARAGMRLIFGAGNSGIMGASARGAFNAGGELLGIAPSYFNTPGRFFSSCSELILTETISDRKSIMGDMADAFAVLPGGIGTYDEFFETLTLKQLGRHTKPIGILNTKGYFGAMLKFLEKTEVEGFMKKDVFDLFKVFSTPGELAEYLIDAIIENKKRG